MSITTRSSDVSETDSEDKFQARQHHYNTRYSSKCHLNVKSIKKIIYFVEKNLNPRQVFTTKELAKPLIDRCLPTHNSKSKGRGDLAYIEEDDDDSSMDYCYDPCPTPSIRHRGNSVCSFFKGSFYILSIASTLWLGYSQYVMDNDLKDNEVQKIRGGNRKEDPQLKLSKELNTKCSDTLKLLMKDPVGRPDFVLESSGGRVVSVDSEAYSSPKTFFGFNLCEGLHSPSSMIQATASPGQCWAFKGHSGKAVLQLIDHVLIDSVTLEHISHTISPSGNIDTAPKDFKIWGLDKPGGNKHFLGQFTYDKNGSTVQTFQINNNTKRYKYVEFEIVSNHGNKDFTCVYRIRVHGTVRNDND